MTDRYLTDAKEKAGVEPKVEFFDVVTRSRNADGTWNEPITHSDRLPPREARSVMVAYAGRRVSQDGWSAVGIQRDKITLEGQGNGVRLEVRMRKAAS